MRIAVAAILVAFSASVAVADFTGKVVSVADGDTITVLRDGREQVKVRFDGIDAPEKGQPFGDAATKVTSARPRYPTRAGDQTSAALRLRTSIRN